MAWINGHEIPFGVFAEVEGVTLGAESGNVIPIITYINITEMGSMSEPEEIEGD